MQFTILFYFSNHSVHINRISYVIQLILFKFLYLHLCPVFNHFCRSVLSFRQSPSVCSLPPTVVVFSQVCFVCHSRVKWFNFGVHRNLINCEVAVWWDFWPVCKGYYKQPLGFYLHKLALMLEIQSFSSSAVYKCILNLLHCFLSQNTY